MYFSFTITTVGTRASNVNFAVVRPKFRATFFAHDPTFAELMPYLSVGRSFFLVNVIILHIA